MKNQELTLEELAAINGGLMHIDEWGGDEEEESDDLISFKDLSTDSKKRFNIRF